MGELKDLWNLNQKLMENKTINQIDTWISNLNNEEKKKELREFFGIIPLNKIEDYIEECTKSKSKSAKKDREGFIFQDLVNELGKRLDYDVKFGVYKGKKKAKKTEKINGYDGLWTKGEDCSIVVESKVSDIFLNLDTVNEYKEDLVKEGNISANNTSILIVLGREDQKNTTSLIKGSKYSENTVKITAESLVKLAKMKSTNKSRSLDERIKKILKSTTNCDADEIVDILFLENEENMPNKKLNKRLIKKIKKVNADAEIYQEKMKNKMFINKNVKKLPVNFYESAVDNLEKTLKIKLHKQEGRSRILYTDNNKKYGILMSISKERKEKYQTKYWFAYHDRFSKYASECEYRYIAFSCGSENKIVLVPMADMEKHKNELNKTIKNEKIHWHVHIIDDGKDIYMQTPLGINKKWILDKYVVKRGA